MIFYLIGFLFLAYEIDKFLKHSQYTEAVIKVDDALKSKNEGRDVIWTKVMKNFLAMEILYSIWSIIGLFSNLRLYFLWLLVPPLLGIFLSKSFTAELKERRKEGWYRFVTCILFGVIPLLHILYHAWANKVPY
jgi:hypothetical protein